MNIQINWRSNEDGNGNLIGVWTGTPYNTGGTYGVDRTAVAWQIFTEEAGPCHCKVTKNGSVVSEEYWDSLGGLSNGRWVEFGNFSIGDVWAVTIDDALDYLTCAEPNGMQMMVWDVDGKLYTKTLSAAGGAFSLADFPDFSGGASRVGVRVIQSDEIAKTGQKWRFTLIRGAADVALSISFPPGVTISGTTYTTIFDFEFSAGARSLASGILPLPNFFDLGLQYQLVAEGTCEDLEEEDAYDDVPAEDGPAIPPEPPPTPEEPPEVEEPIWPTEPSPPTAPTVPTAPSAGCECEIYIAEAIMWAASWMADCFALGVQTFVEWAPWFVETMWEQAWALYEFHGEKIERHHEETLTERQRQTVLLERQAESLESIAQSLSDIRDFGPVEVSYELGLPGQVQVQGIGDDTDDFYEGGV